MGQVFAFANMKGGVGKTTAAVLFADTLAKQGRKVLFLDLDAQASASFAIAGYDGLKAVAGARRNLCGFLENCQGEDRFRPLDGFIHRNASTLDDCRSVDLVQSHPDLRLVERAYLSDALRRSRVFTPVEQSFQSARRPLFDEIRRLAASYDAVVVDCPPGVSLFVEAGVAAADVIICPTALEPLATLGLETIISRFYLGAWLRGELTAFGRSLPRLRVLLSRVDASAPRQAVERDRVDALLLQPSWTEANVSLLDEAIEASSVLAGVFSDPDLTRSYEERYGVFSERAHAIAAGIENDAAAARSAA